MRTKLMLSMTAGLAVILSQGVSHQALAAGAALTGQVSSAEEGNMEGMLVSAKKVGSTITTTVVTDEKGHYAFPASRLSPGHYAITIRAVGYKLDGPKAADVVTKKALSDDLLHIEEGALYPALQHMLKTGWLKSEMRLSARNRPVRTFKLTAAGRNVSKKNDRASRKCLPASTAFFRA